MMFVYFALLENPEDEPQFEVFYNKFYNIVFYITKDYLKNIESAEDCAHEVMIFFAKKFHNLPKDFNDKKLMNYIRVVSKCMAIDMYRKNKKHTENVVDNDISEFFNIGEEDFDEFEHMDLKIAIDKLPDELKHIFYLKYILELSGADIAELLNISQPLVRKRCMLGMQLVRDYVLGEEKGDKENE